MSFRLARSFTYNSSSALNNVSNTNLVLGWQISLFGFLERMKYNYPDELICQPNIKFQNEILIPSGF